MDDSRLSRAAGRATARRRHWLIAVGAVLALVSAYLVLNPTVAYLREQNEIKTLATPAPTLPATSTTTSSSPAAPAVTTHPTKAAPTTSQPAKPNTPFVPAHIWIDAIKVNTEIVPKGSIYAMDDHLGRKTWQYGVPTGPKAMYQVAWWSDGARAGEHKKGMIPILLGHTQIGGYGVFNNLGDLKSGQRMVLQSKDKKHTMCYGTLNQPVTGIPKDDADALLKVLNNAPKQADAATITCSGGVDKTIMSRKYNTVVFFTQVQC